MDRTVVQRYLKAQGILPCVRRFAAEAKPGMEAMRALRSVVTKLLLPIACFACIAWVAIFVVIYTKMPQHNIGITVLIVMSGLVLLFPWMGMVLAMLRRISGQDAPPETPDDKA